MRQAGEHCLRHLAFGSLAGRQQLINVILLVSCDDHALGTNELPHKHAIMHLSQVCKQARRLASRHDKAGAGKLQDCNFL